MGGGEGNGKNMVTGHKKITIYLIKCGGYFVTVLPHTHTPNTDLFSALLYLLFYPALYLTSCPVRTTPVFSQFCGLSSWEYLQEVRRWGTERPEYLVILPCSLEEHWGVAKPSDSRSHLLALHLSTVSPTPYPSDLGLAINPAVTHLKRQNFPFTLQSPL